MKYTQLLTPDMHSFLSPFRWSHAPVVGNVWCLGVIRIRGVTVAVQDLRTTNWKLMEAVTAAEKSAANVHSNNELTLKKVGPGLIPLTDFVILICFCDRS